MAIIRDEKTISIITISHVLFIYNSSRVIKYIVSRSSRQSRRRHLGCNI
jgi:hypothetical protein